jgi:hypothetical protein
MSKNKSQKKAVDPKVVETKVEETNVVETKVEEKKINKDHDNRALSSAVPPTKYAPVVQKLNSEVVVVEARDLFGKRAHVSNLTTETNVSAVGRIIDLVEGGADWKHSAELREAFKHVTNSFSKGPVLTTDLQLLAGKIVEYKVAEVPIFKIGSKVGSRFIYQNDEGFIKTVGRLPITKAEATEGEEPDSQGQKTFVSHCPLCDIDFWTPEPQHQIHCPVCSNGIKKSGSKTTGPTTKEETIASLTARLKRFEELAQSGDDVTRKIASERVNTIKTRLRELAA